MTCRYVYLTHNPPSNVVLSQVVELIEVFDRSQIAFDLVFMLSGGNYLKHLRGRLNGMAVVRQRLRGRVRCLPTPRLDRPSGLCFAARLLDWCYPPQHQGRLIVHARNISSACIAAELKSRRHDVRTLFDVRGDKVSEYLFLNPEQAALPAQRERVLKIIREREGLAAATADHMFCVSHVLRELVVERTGFAEERITVVPCCADDALFRFDASARETLRRELQLDGRFVLVYSGGMTKWHCPERIFAVASTLMQQHADMALLVLTPDRDKAERMADAVLPNGRWVVTSAGRQDVAKYLSAADMGMLIREDDPLNRVASPTKFAEYVMIGLPVMISDHIGDYSAFVADNRCGFILPDNLNPKEVLRRFSEFRGLQRPGRKETAGLGQAHFSKECYAPQMIDIYRQLCNHG